MIIILLFSMFGINFSCYLQNCIIEYHPDPKDYIPIFACMFSALKEPNNSPNNATEDVSFFLNVFYIQIQLTVVRLHCIGILYRLKHVFT